MFGTISVPTKENVCDFWELQSLPKKEKTKGKKVKLLFGQCLKKGYI